MGINRIWWNWVLVAYLRFDSSSICLIEVNLLLLSLFCSLIVIQSIAIFFLPNRAIVFFSTKSSTKNSSLLWESTESGEIESWSLISGSTHHDCLDWIGFCCFHFILASAKLLKATEGVWIMFGGPPYSNKLTSYHFYQFWPIRSNIFMKNAIKMANPVSQILNVVLSINLNPRYVHKRELMRVYDQTRVFLLHVWLLLIQFFGTLSKLNFSSDCRKHFGSYSSWLA